MAMELLDTLAPLAFPTNTTCESYSATPTTSFEREMLDPQSPRPVDVLSMWTHDFPPTKARVPSARTAVLEMQFPMLPATGWFSRTLVHARVVPLSCETKQHSLPLVQVLPSKADLVPPVRYMTLPVPRETLKAWVWALAVPWLLAKVTAPVAGLSAA